MFTAASCENMNPSHGFSYMNFTSIISSAIFLYSLGMLLEFASFLWLRRKMPTLKRPYQIPLSLLWLAALSLVPCAFLVVIMVYATKVVYLVSGLMTVGGIAWFFLMRLCKSRKILKFSNGDISELLEEDR